MDIVFELGDIVDYNGREGIVIAIEHEYLSVAMNGGEHCVLTMHESMFKFVRRCSKEELLTYPNHYAGQVARIFP